ncbi:MAG: hypothetical protein KGQ60_18000 [Planctomycetes bacterium]|nr:hypothetical protein [Planctomycetota bacterium]
MKPIILFATTYTEYDFLRQVPRHSDPWCQFDFTTDPSCPNLFGCVVYDNIPTTLDLSIPRSHCLLITGEPPSLRTYRSRYTSQFGSVRTSHPALRHPNKVLDHEGQPWYYALQESETHGRILDYDDLFRLERPIKAHRLSVIASNKSTTEDHRQRLRFVEHLREAFPSELEVYGRGIRDVRDKADAIYPFEYHIVLENDHSSHYVSEKLTDSFLGWAYPFYSGSPNASRILPAGCFERIDMHDPESSIQTIRQAMESEVARERASLFAQARTKVLRELNLFAMINEHFLKLPPSTSKNRSNTIYPKNQTWQQIRSQLKRLALGR